MKTTLAFLFLFVLSLDAHPVSFAIRSHPYAKTKHEAVVNGTLDKTKLLEVLIELPRKDFCGGTILGDRFILTAAHCFLNDSVCQEEEDVEKLKKGITRPDEIQVYMEGTCNPLPGYTCPANETGHTVKVTKVHLLEEYYKNNLCTKGDMAILELAEAVGDHGARLSTDKNVPTSGHYQSSGYGFDPIDTKATHHLLKTVKLEVKKCNASHGDYDSICTVEIDHDVCKGDSGSGLMNEKNLVFGVVSAGVPCKKTYNGMTAAEASHNPYPEYDGGIFTSVSHHLNFICRVIGKHQDCPQDLPKPDELFVTLP